jgi:hypothetical protein
MSLQIENRLQETTSRFNVGRKIRSLLRVVPNEHLVGLDKIIIVDEIKDKKRKRIGGLYHPRHDKQPCTIEIGFNSIYGGMPKVFFFLPLAAKFTLADTLYHEIGHHYHHKFVHGITKKRREDFADDYSKKMLKKAFFWWLIFLWPLTPLIRYMAKVVNKER